MHILSLNMMIKSWAILMFPRSPLGYINIKITNDFHNRVQAKNMNFSP